MEEDHVEPLNLFEPPSVNTGVAAKEWIEFRPINQITQNSPLEFSVPPLSNAYMDLKNSRIKISCRLTDGNGQPLADGEPVAPINLVLQSMFSQVDCSLQQTSVSALGNNYPYRAYLDTVLQKKNWNVVDRQSQLFIKDVTSDGSNAMDDPDPTTGTNEGLYKRYSYLRRGKILEMEGPLYLDFFQQNKVILNGVGLMLKFWPSKNSFRLMSSNDTPDYHLQIVDATFRLCVQTPNSALLVAHDKMSKQSPAIYPLSGTTIKIASIGAGNYGFTTDDMFQGEVPSRLILGMVTSRAYSGDYKRSPFNFQPFGCNFVALYVDGQSVPTKPLQPDFDNDAYVEAYRTLTSFGDEVDVDRAAYKDGFTLFVLDLSQHGDFESKRRGHCRLELRFARPLSESVTLIMHAQFPRIFYVDESRNVVST